MNNRFYITFVALVFSVLYLCAQNTKVVDFKKTFKDDNGEIHTVEMKMTCIQGNQTLEREYARFFFNDTVSSSLQDAIAKYMLQYKKESTSTKIGVTDEFSASLTGYKQGRYYNYYLKAEQNVLNTKGKLPQEKKTRLCDFVYDAINDRILTLEDIFVPHKVSEIKWKLGYRELHLYIADDHLTWGYENAGKLITEREDYWKEPYLYKESFRRLLGGTAFDRKALIKSNNSLVKTYVKSKSNYPKEAMEKGIEGTVKVAYHVDINGVMSNIVIIQHADSILEREVMRVMNDMPKLIPAIKNGENVSSDDTLSVRFPTHPAVFPKKRSDARLYPTTASAKDNATTYVNYMVKRGLVKKRTVVNVRIIVDSTGQVCEAEVLDNKDIAIIHEALRLVYTMPEWQPAKHRNETISSKFVIPIIFEAIIPQ